MTETNPDTAAGTSLKEARDGYLRSVEKGEKSGNYRRAADGTISTFIGWADGRGIETIGDVDEAVMAQYAQRLKKRVNAHASSNGDDGCSGRSAHTYWAQLRAWITWCVKWGYLDRNPAKSGRAEEELPPRNAGATSDNEQQQFWSPDDRERICRFVDARARSAIDEDPVAPPALRRQRVRDRALVLVLSYSGVRGGEVLRDPNDTRRTGLRWRDVDLDDSTLWVLGKNQQTEYAPILRQAHSALRQWRRVQDPAGNDWPVFVTDHRPTLYRLARDALEAAGVTGDDQDAAIQADHPLDIIREHGETPPAMTTEGGRNVMQRLCEAAGIEIDDRHGYLAPHGGRRGAGDTAVRELGVDDAQRLLRHSSSDVTTQQYSHIEASEVAGDAGDAFDRAGNSEETDE